MHLECLGLREAFATAFAAEPTLGLMYKNVPFHVGFEREGPTTNGAREWLHGAVGDQVIAQVVLLHEAHAAVGTGKTAHLCVDQHVIPQLTWVLEQPLTHLALQSVGCCGRGTTAGTQQGRWVVLGNV